jgi:hypothetical protein
MAPETSSQFVNTAGLFMFLLYTHTAIYIWYYHLFAVFSEGASNLINPW